MKITIIDGHPDPEKSHLTHALAQRYASAAEAAGHEIRRIDIAHAQEDIAWADHLALFLHLWMADMPSLLKAFLEQTFRPEVARTFRGKSARIIVTMGAPAFAYYGPMGAFMLKMLARLMMHAGIRPVSSTVIANVEHASVGKRDRWFAKMDVLAERDGARRPHRVATVAKVLATAAGIAGAAYLGSVLTSWARYGATSQNAESDSLLDRFMPNYELSLRHATVVHAPASLTFAAVRLIDFERSPVVRALPVNLPFEQLTAIGWNVLAIDLGHEIVLGSVTKPWQSNAQFRPMDAREFAAFAEPGYAKIVLAIRVDEVSSEHSEARTETRVQTTDPISRARFRRYWALLSPGMIVIRRVLLQQVKNEAEAVWERTRPLAGMQFEDTEGRGGGVS